MGFRPCDFCMNQLLPITYEVCKFFHGEYEVRGFVLDISNRFDKVWLNGLIFKLNQNGISGNLMSLIISSILENRGS